MIRGKAKAATTDILKLPSNDCCACRRNSGRRKLLERHKRIGWVSLTLASLAVSLPLHRAGVSQLSAVESIVQME